MKQLFSIVLCCSLLSCALSLKAPWPWQKRTPIMQRPMQRLSYSPIPIGHPAAYRVMPQQPPSKLQNLVNRFRQDSPSQEEHMGNSFYEKDAIIRQLRRSNRTKKAALGVGAIAGAGLGAWGLSQYFGQGQSAPQPPSISTPQAPGSESIKPEQNAPSPAQPVNPAATPAQSGAYRQADGRKTAHPAPEAP